METNTGFESWLDTKINQLREQGKNPTVQRDSRHSGFEPYGESLNVPGDRFQRTAAAAASTQVKPEMALRSEGSREGGGDYYKFVWNEDEQTQERIDSPELESPKDVVARILRETEDYATTDTQSKGHRGQRPKGGQGAIPFQDFTRESGDGESATHSPTDSLKPGSPPSSVQVAFRKYQSDFEHMTQDAYLDDGIAGDIQFGDNAAGDSRVRALLPMDTIEMELESEEEEETMMDAAPYGRRSVEAGYGDTTPIVTVDQAQLSESFLKRKQRIRIAVSVAIGVVCLTAFALVTYLVVHFLSTT